MSKPLSIKVKITFVKSPDAERRIADLVQLLARSAKFAPDKKKEEKKSA